MIQIIPAIDIIDGKCVRLRQGDYNAATEYRGHPADMARMFADCGLTRLHVVDLDGAKAGHPKNLRTLESIAHAVDMLIEWGGGIKDMGDVSSAFSAGARCVIGGSVAVKNPGEFARWLDHYSSDAISLGADARDGKVAVSGWLEDTDVTLDGLIDNFLAQGLSQAIVTDISRDGMLQGPNIQLYVDLQQRFESVDITVSGGISSIGDIIRLDECGLRRVIVGKAIYEGRITTTELTRYAENKR